MSQVRSAEFGMRNVKGSSVLPNDLTLQFRIPHSAFRTWTTR